MDTGEIISKLFHRTRLVVDEKDPIFLVVELNKIILENEADEIANRISVVAEGFEHITRRSADELIETINKASSVLQTQITSFEASVQKLSVPDYLATTLSSEAGKQSDEGVEFKKQFQQWLLIAGIYGFGLVTGFLISGFMWVFFR